MYHRDNYTCFVCGEDGNTAYLNCHHVIPVAYCQGTSLETDPYNLVTLCSFCHSWCHEQGKFYNPYKPSDMSMRSYRFAVAYFLSRYLFPGLHGDGEKPTPTLS